MEENRIYNDRFRIFLILYFFSINYSNSDNPTLKKVFKSEVRIQKIDFLIRNPDYLCFLLLQMIPKKEIDRNEIKKIVKSIFDSKEPILRRYEMEKFFFGAWEDLDDVIAFLKAIGFVDYSSKKNVILKETEKRYFITELAVTKTEKSLSKLHCLKWYVDRCNLIKKYFGEYSGSQLKDMQYEIDEYKKACFNDKIQNIQDKVKVEFNRIFGEEL